YCRPDANADPLGLPPAGGIRIAVAIRGLSVPPRGPYMISSRLDRSIVSLSNLPLLLIYDLIETIEPKDPATHFRNGRNGPFFLLSWGGPGWDLSTPGKSPADPWPEAPSARDPDTRTPGSGSGHSRNPAGFSTGVPIPGRRRSASSGEAYGTTPSAPEVPPSDTHPATPVPRGRSSAF